jgi:hypothetical protein
MSGAVFSFPITLSDHPERKTSGSHVEHQNDAANRNDPEGNAGQKSQSAF